MLLSISLTALLAAAATAKVVIVQVGNPTAAEAPNKLKFLPDVVMADPGDTVRFMFMGNHSVTQQDDFNKCAPGAPSGAAPFDSGIKQKGETFDLPPSAMTPGSVINYYCKIKQGAHCRAPNFMQGTVVITGGAGVAGAAANATGGAVAGAGAPTTIQVVVGKDGQNQYSPSNIEASAGDSIMFMWTGGQKMHNVVPSDQPQSCQRSPRTDTDPILKALASGAPQNSGQHEFKIPATVKPGDMMYYFCSVGTHCTADKMYGSIKIVPPGTARNAVGAGAGAAGAAGAADAAGAAGAGGAAGAAADPTADAGTTATAEPASASASGATGMTATALAIVVPAAAAMLRLA